MCLPFSRCKRSDDGILTTDYIISRRSLVTWSIDPGRRILFDSGTDFAVLGHAFEPVKIYDARINLSSGLRSDNEMPVTANLCDAITVVKDLCGNKYILKYHYGINHCEKGLQESLLQPLQIRMSGNSFSDVHLHENGDGVPSQTLCIGDKEIFLFSNGVHMFLEGRKPTREERQSLPVLNLTSESIWDPDFLFQQAQKSEKLFLGKRKLTGTSRRTAIVDGSNTVNREANLAGATPMNSDTLDHSELAGFPRVEFPITELVGHKQSRKIWKGRPPNRTFFYIQGKYIPFHDPQIDDLQPTFAKVEIDKWCKILCCNDRKRVSATLRNTTRSHELLETMQGTIPYNFHKPRAPQLNARRCPGVVYTDTAFANVLGKTRATMFQAFLHQPSCRVYVVLMTSKATVKDAVSRFSSKHGFPNHLHGDRARELQLGKTKKFCEEHAIYLTATGERNKPTQNTHIEHMIGVLKRLTFQLLMQAKLDPEFWDYALQYACVIWNCTSKKKLHNATPDQLFFGYTCDLSHLRYPFGTHVNYRSDAPNFPGMTGIRRGIYLGPNVDDGDAFTYWIYDLQNQNIMSKCTIWLDLEARPRTAPAQSLGDFEFYKSKECDKANAFVDTAHDGWVPAEVITATSYDDWTAHYDICEDEQHQNCSNDVALQETTGHKVIGKHLCDS